MSIFKRFSRRVTILAVLGSLVVAAAAIAYFTGGATGQFAATGAKIGTQGTVPLLATSVMSNTTLMPGSGQVDVTFTISNTNPNNQSQSAAKISLLTYNIGNLQNGCKAEWFSLTPSTLAVPTDIAWGASVTDTVHLTMLPNTTDNQDVCQGQHPLVALTVS